MAKAADFDGKANETEVVTSESVKGKRKTSILDESASVVDYNQQSTESWNLS